MYGHIWGQVMMSLQLFFFKNIVPTNINVYF